MLVYSENGEIHFLCYLFDRFSMNAAQNEGTAALLGEGVEDCLEVPQLVTRLQRFLGGIVRLKHIQFGDKFQRDDLFPSGLVNQQVSSDLKQKGLAGMRAADVAVGIGAGHAFRDEIINVTTIGRDAA